MCSYLQILKKEHISITHLAQKKKVIEGVPQGFIDALNTLRELNWSGDLRPLFILWLMTTVMIDYV